MPMMAFIGVRISWLMLARNSLLARVASSGHLASPLQFGLAASSGGALALQTVAERGHRAGEVAGLVGEVGVRDRRVELPEGDGLDRPADPAAGRRIDVRWPRTTAG